MTIPTFTSSWLALAVRSALPAIQLRNIAPRGHPTVVTSPSSATDPRVTKLITSSRRWVGPNARSERHMV